MPTKALKNLEVVQRAGKEILLIDGENSFALPKETIIKAAIALFLESVALEKKLRLMQIELGTGYGRHTQTNLGVTKRNRDEKEGL